MSAPNRPIEDNPKFLQNKKKTRKKKVSRSERDEINECDEDEFEETDLLNLNSANNRNPVLGPRSRSVIGGTTCDIETLVSLLSSGGSDSEKEDSTAGADSSSVSTANCNIIGSSLKSRAPMLKKAGKSVSFQESELKQSAGLNRDYYPAAYRKPPSLQPIANRIRRSQQLANSLNAFHLKDIKKSSSEENKSDEDTGSNPSSKEKDKEKSPGAPQQVQKPPIESSGQDLVDGQTPKERECYRLFQKMSNMGLSVSYDTILRGMLTPTELRVLQKQRSKLQKQQESRQSSSETDNVDGDFNENNSNNANSTNECEIMELEISNDQAVGELQQVDVVGQ